MSTYYVPGTLYIKLEAQCMKSHETQAQRTVGPGVKSLLVTGLWSLWRYDSWVFII